RPPMVSAPSAAAPSRKRRRLVNVGRVGVVIDCPPAWFFLVAILLVPRLAVKRGTAAQSFGRPSTRSPMMLRWISLVPPAIVYWRALTTRLNQRGASGTSAVG